MEGKKFDTDKAQYDLVDAKFLDDLAKVLTIGAQKYDRFNWIKVEKHRYEAALLRHIQAWRMKEQTDPETGIHHLAHAAANLMFLYCHENMEPVSISDIEDIEDIGDVEYEGWTSDFKDK